MRRALTVVIYALSGLIGLVAFTYPLLGPLLQRWSPLAAAGFNPAPLANAPLLTMILLLLCLAVLLVEVQGQAVSAKVVAALGVLVAVTAVLRFIEVALPGLGGFSPIFAPITLAGYVFGARFGFLMGAMTLLASALVTGGVGPWLPYQMFAAGWVGLTAGWLPHPRRPGVQITLLVAFGFLWGLLFGAIMNLYFWPFISDNSGLSWQPGAGFQDGLARYAAYYLTTSLVWDLGRALGNVVLIVALGMPTVRALTRFRDRFSFLKDEG